MLNKPSLILASLLSSAALGFTPATATAQTTSALLTEGWQDGQRVVGRADLWGWSSETKGDGSTGDDASLVMFRSRLGIRLDGSAPPVMPSDAPSQVALDGSDTTASATNSAVLGNPVESVAPRFAPALGHELTQLDFSSDDPLVPQRLARHEVALGLPTGTASAFDHAWDTGVVLGLGHASSNPYGDGRGWYGIATLLATTQLSNRDTLTLGITYDGNRSVLPDTPLPLLEYSIAVDPENQSRLGIVLGYPESRLYYRPTPGIELSAGLAQLDAVSAEVVWHTTDRLALTASYGGFYDMFHTPGTSGVHNSGYRRDFFVSQRLEAGVRYAVTDGVTLSASGGYAFAQSLRRGYDARSTEEVVQFDDAPFARVMVSYGF